jgi:PTS system mannitol-specific IIA component
MSPGFFGKKERQQSSVVDTGEPTNLVNSAGNNGCDVLVWKNILIGQKSVTKYEAIEAAGRLLVDGGYVYPGYIEAMKEREETLTTYIGNGVAIPHGVGAARDLILKSGITVIQYPEGVVFGEGKAAFLVIGIAGKGNEHMEIISNLAEFIQDEAILEELFRTKEAERLYAAFTNNH